MGLRAASAPCFGERAISFNFKFENFVLCTLVCFGVFEQLNLFRLNLAAAVKLYVVPFFADHDG